MRILVVGPTAHYGNGGIETQIAQLIPAFQQLGHHCVAVDTFHQAWSSRLLIDLNAALGQSDIVLMMGLNLKAYGLTLLRRRPVLLSHHIMVGGTRLSQHLHRWVGSSLPSVFNSSFLASREPGSRWPAKVIHPCYPASLYPTQLHNTVAWDRRHFDVGFLGRLIPEKGADLLLQACADLNRPGLRLQMIGSGPCREQLEGLAAKTDMSLHFTGALDAAGVAQALQQVKVLVIPSQWQEPFGVVMLEALAAGCHVIASAIGGLPEAGSEFATYVPPSDPLALKAALERLIEAPAPQHLAALQLHLERFQPQVVAGLLEAELQRVLQQ